MIHTLSSSLALYHIHRNRVAMLTAMEKRRAIMLLSGIVACVTLVSYIFIVYL